MEDLQGSAGEPVPETSASSEATKRQNGLAKKLAASDKKTRDKGVALLTKWLQSRVAVDEDDLKKIWKGLFYCFWHTDKAPMQSDLASSLAGILHSLKPSTALLYFKVFLVTMRREWQGIDRLRLDKFYMLVRRFLAAMFVHLAARGWKKVTVQKYMTCLCDRTLLAQDRFAALGLSLHITDIYVEELQKCAGVPQGRALALVEPFLSVLNKVSDKALLRRAQESVFYRILEARTDLQAKQGSQKAHPQIQGSAATPGQAGHGHQAPGSTFVEQLDLAELAARLFDLASAPEGAAKNRKLMYEVHARVKAVPPPPPPPVPESPSPAANPAVSPSQGAASPKEGSKKRRVRFCLKQNIEFVKNGTVPPVSMRTPPSATPRGSALKRGVKPGPINKKLLKAAGSLWTHPPKGSPALLKLKYGRAASQEKRPNGMPQRIKQLRAL